MPQTRSTLPDPDSVKKASRKTRDGRLFSCMNAAMRCSAALWAWAILSLLFTRDGISQDRPATVSTSPWPEDSGVIALNLATNADQAWTLISGVRSSEPSRKTPEIKTSAMAADMCREFARRFPNDGRIDRANRFRQEFLMRSIELGNIERIEEFEGLFPKKDTELARMRAFREFPRGPSAVRHAWEKNLRALNPWTPEIVYDVLLLAEQSDPVNARRLAAELLTLPATTKVLQSRATRLQEKYAPLDKPVQLKATTLDGKEVDLEQWKDKVVLVHFWTPKASHVASAQPDASGVGLAKTLYEKFHVRGLEALSINLSSNEKLVRAPVRVEQRIPWPHYWAGTNLPVAWRAVAGMPTAYSLNQTTFALVDRNGILCDRDVPRAELAERIEKLLK